MRSRGVNPRVRLAMLHIELANAVYRGGVQTGVSAAGPRRKRSALAGGTDGAVTAGRALAYAASAGSAHCFRGHEPLSAPTAYAARRSPARISAMADVTGKTSNGFAYEGDYQLPSAGRVHWSVTFRHNGDFAGIR